MRSPQHVYRQRQSRAIKSNQRPSTAITLRMRTAIKGNQRQSRAINGHHLENENGHEKPSARCSIISRAARSAARSRESREAVPGAVLGASSRRSAGGVGSAVSGARRSTPRCSEAAVRLWNEKDGARWITHLWGSAGAVVSTCMRGRSTRGGGVEVV
jgi:hypothetical protein